MSLDGWTARVRLRHVAGALVVLSAATAGLWFAVRDESWANAWLPNIAIGFAGLFVASLIVDVAVDGERQRRRQPRRAAAVERIRLAFGGVVISGIVLLSENQVDAGLKCPPEIETSLTWLSNELRRAGITERGVVVAADSLSDLARDLSEIRVRDGDVLDDAFPQLLPLLDEVTYFGRSMAEAVRLIATKQQTDLGRAEYPGLTFGALAYLVPRVEASLDATRLTMPEETRKMFADLLSAAGGTDAKSDSD